jgi:DNA-binding transcriptional MerR regulator/methylmalonyl-CoA mutase cobalamin-binding subunit
MTRGGHSASNTVHSFFVPVRYPIRAVSRLTGISLDTLRAWERRYKVVSPERTERGRLYSDNEIQRLMLLRDAITRGHAIGQVATLSDVELRDLGKRSAEVERANPPVEELLAPGIATLLSAIEAFDSAGATEEMGRLATLVPTADLVTQVALPLMRVVGDRWKHGSLGIAHEHLASAILRNLFGSLLRIYKPVAPVVKLVLATPSAEQHEFGILAAAMLAAPMGLEPIYLGPNLPADEILVAAEKSRSRVVVVGVLDQSAESHALLELRKIASMLPKAVELWVGGRSVADQPEFVRDRVTFMEDFQMLEAHLRRLRQTA